SIQYEKENREYKRLLKDETKKKIDFFVNLAHEIKTPLTLIQNNFDEYLKSLKNKVTPDLKGIKFYISKLCKDITNLLDAVNIERSKILYSHNSVIHLSMIVYRCINFFKAVARKKNITLTFTSADSLFCKIDPTALERIVNNLLDNAIKHIGKGDRISVTLTSDETNIYLKIKDNGLGIPVELQKNIFLPYYQISNEKSNTQGLGLGLSIVKHIIDSLSGKIEIESEINKGTKITVILPKYTIKENDVISEYIPEDQMIIQENITPEKETYDKTKYTLFFIEDKIELITTMQKSMKEFFNFYYALDGQEALEKIERIPLPDIIISDIMMDRMDGHAFHTELKYNEKYKNIPFLFLTARTVQQEKEESLEKGILDYIYKPFKMNELIKKVLALLKYRESLITMERSAIEEKITSLLWSNKDFKFLKFESKCNEFKVSAREKEVIQLLMSGMSYKEIAANLYIETTTVSKHIRHIYKKCKVHSNIELLKLFLE
ncbi:MAG: response regulator, partial [Spirochaetales bacterium]|nr:response regulator [Spirochaetales bacterium]